ncbi:MAG: hypothetical protein LE168_05520 [Endomicrobium sp.]|nr:hypothetical protein [Endomicrobium sp.]
MYCGEHTYRCAAIVVGAAIIVGGVSWYLYNKPERKLARELAKILPHSDKRFLPTDDKQRKFVKDYLIKLKDSSLWELYQNKELNRLDVSSYGKDFFEKNQHYNYVTYSKGILIYDLRLPETEEDAIKENEDVYKKIDDMYEIVRQSSDSDSALIQEAYTSGFETIAKNITESAAKSDLLKIFWNLAKRCWLLSSVITNPEYYPIIHSR